MGCSQWRHRFSMQNDIHKIHCLSKSLASKDNKVAMRQNETELRNLTRVLLAVWIFHMLGRGGVFETPPPSNSAPRQRSDKPKSAFESSSEIITKVFQPIFR